MNELNNHLDLNTLFGPINSEWTSTTRSIRINGKVTSVRLENFYWRVLTDIAESQNLMLSQLMTELSRMAKNSETEHTNFTSFVRVCCVRYLEKSNDTEIAAKATENSHSLYSRRPEVQQHARLQAVG